MASLEEQLRASVLYLQAKERNEGKRGLVAVVDLAHLFRSAWHATSDQQLSAAYDYTTDKLAQILSTRGYDRVICAIDAPPYRRKQFYPEYKSNRDKPDPAMVEQYRRTQERARQLGCVVLESEGFEADDIAATLCRHLTHDGYSVHVFTADKDLLQLVSDKVHVINTRSGDVIDPKAVFEKFGVVPNQMVDLLALMGDSSDNVPGVKGIGGGTASSLLAKHGTLEGVLAAEGLTGRAAVLGTKEARDNALLSAALVKLVADVPLDYGAVWEEQEVEDIERAAIVEEATEADDDGPDPERPAGDVLAGGALARQRAARQLVPEQESQELAPAPAPEGIVRQAEVRLRPGLTLSGQDFKLAYRLAESFNSSGLYRRKFSSVDEIFSVMLLAHELDLGVQTCLQAVHVIEGRPTLGSHLIAALAQRDPSVVYFECAEATGESCTYVCKKKGLERELSFTYTLEDALNDGHRWAKNPKNQKAMLRKTCAAQAARLWVPGAALGLYAPEEFGVEVDEAAA